MTRIGRLKQGLRNKKRQPLYLLDRRGFSGIITKHSPNAALIRQQKAQLIFKILNFEQRLDQCRVGALAADLDLSSAPGDAWFSVEMRMP